MVYAVCPVPPYSAPTDVVADTTPLLACKGPLSVPNVSVPLNVDAPEKILEFVNVLAVYVFGMVVEALMYELTTEVSRVSAPPVFIRPEPSKLLNNCPLIIKFVVEAVANVE